MVVNTDRRQRALDDLSICEHNTDALDSSRWHHQKLKIQQRTASELLVGVITFGGRGVIVVDGIVELAEQ